MNKLNKIGLIMALIGLVTLSTSMADVLEVEPSHIAISSLIGLGGVFIMILGLLDDDE